MTTLAWLVLAVGLVCLPVPSRELSRLRTLARRGRLARGSPSRPGIARHRSAWRRRRVPPRHLPLVAGAGCGAAACLAIGPIPGVAAGAAAGTAALVLGDVRRRRARAARERELAGCLELLVAELAAGSRPAVALAAAAHGARNYGGVLAHALDATRHGGDPAAALLVERGLASAGHAWRVGVTCGAPLAGVIARVAGDVAARRDVRDEVAAALAGPRSSAALLAGLPALGVALGAGMGAHPVSFLLHSPAGQWVGCAGVLLDIAGVLWTLRILRRAEAA